MLKLRGMTPTIQKYLVSSLITFVATFLTTVGAQLMVAQSTELSYAFLVSLIIVGARAATKSVLESIPTLGRISKG